MNNKFKIKCKLLKYIFFINIMNTYDDVKEYYGKILESTSSLKTSACTMSNRPPDIILDILKKIPNEI